MRTVPGVCRSPESVPAFFAVLVRRHADRTAEDAGEVEDVGDIHFPCDRRNGKRSFREEFRRMLDAQSPDVIRRTRIMRLLPD